MTIVRSTSVLYGTCSSVDSGWETIHLPATPIQLIWELDDAHNIEIQMDGVRVGPIQYQNVGTYDRDVYVPNDGRKHSLRIVDTGNQGTPASESASYEYTSTCEGVVEYRVQQILTSPYTGEKTATLSITNSGSEAYTNRLLLDGKLVGAEFSLEPNAGETRQIVIPADGKKHIIKGELKVGTSYVAEPMMWYLIEGATGPEDPEDPSQVATQFIPGQTIIIQSLESSTPLASDGTEWVVLELSPRGLDQWVPAGSDAGMVAPGEDGTWSATIETNLTDFPVGTGWDIRARRFRNYMPSETITHFFDMVDGSIDASDMPPPIITGPINHTQRGGSWCVIEGTGVPGAKVEFDVQRVTPWGTLDDPPLDTSVGPDGKWISFVWGKQRARPQDFKVLGYRARHKVNGQVSDWSNQLDITWQHPLR